MPLGPVTRAQTAIQAAIQELATAYYNLGLGPISDEQIQLLSNDPSRINALMNQIKQQSQQPHHVVTRSQSHLEKLAKHYLSLGFINIPDDELRMLRANTALVQMLIAQIAELKHIEDQLRLRHDGHGSRESIVGPIVGSEYKKLMNEFNTLIQQQSMGGKKRFRKSRKNYKSKKSKKSKKAMQRKGKKTYKKLKSKR